jgi:WD40 repeat protein
MSERFQDRLSDFALPAETAGERPRIYAGERGSDGRILTRRTLVGLLAAGAADMFPKTARGAGCSTCPTGTFAHEILLASLSFSPDGKTLITAGQDQFLKFWSMPGGALFRTVSTVDIPYRVAVSPDGNWIAVGMANGNLNLWTAAGQGPTALVGHTDSVGALAFAPNSQTLVSASLDHTTKLWSVKSGALLTSFTDSTDAMNTVAVAPQGRYFVTAGSQVYLRLLSNGQILQSRPGNTFAISADGELLATHDGGQLYLAAFPSLDPIASVADQETAASMEFSANGKLLAIGYGNPATRLYSVPSLTLLSQLEANEGLCLSLDMDSTVNNLAVASGKSVRLYSLHAGAREPICFMDVAASSPAATGAQYSRKGVVYTVPCMCPIPPGAVCTCNCVPGNCPCVADTGCDCVSDVSCSCVSDTGCNCVSDTGCACDGDTGCGCVSDVECGCVSDYGCGCVSDTGCSCVSDTGCGCVSDTGCGCDGDTGCGCDGDAGRVFR